MVANLVTRSPSAAQANCPELTWTDVPWREACPSSLLLSSDTVREDHDPCLYLQIQRGKTVIPRRIFRHSPGTPRSLLVSPDTVREDRDPSWYLQIQSGNTAIPPGISRYSPGTPRSLLVSPDTVREHRDPSWYLQIQSGCQCRMKIPHSSG